MALSGTYTWTENRDQVINGALRKLGVLPSGGAGTTNQLSEANEALNNLLKAFNAEGMPLWALVNFSWTVTAGTNSYNIGVGLTLNTPPPLKIIQARYLTSGSNTAVNMQLYDRFNFNKLPSSSTTTGTPIILNYEPTLTSGALDSGTIRLWPYPIDSTTTIYIDYQRPFQDTTSASQNFDFPPYWINALIYNLAWLLAPEYGTPPTDRGLLMNEAKYWKDEALSFGTEEGSLYLMPDRSQTR